MAEQEEQTKLVTNETKQNHVQLTIEKRESIFAYNTVKDTHEDLKNHVELNERDITDMLKTQKEYQQFGQWTCCGQKTLSRLSKIKSLMVTMLFCGAGLGWAYYLRDRNAELSRRTLFYTIFVSFSILCIPATGIINYVTMSLLIKATKDTWKVFYIKGIKTRLFWLELSILWFSGFWCFGRFYHYPYNENIFAAILCVLLSSSTFIVTHFFIRYTALNGYFDIFKIEARKLKTYVTMIEMMANIPKKRREFNGNSKRVKKNQKQASLHKSVRFLPQEKVEMKENNHINSNNFPETLFSIPVMNFLIDFPSTNAKQTAKKERKRKVTFNLIKEDRESIGKISAEIKKKDDKRKQKQKQIDDEKKHQENNDNETDDLGIQMSETDDLEGWLKIEVTKENKQSLLLKESLNKMNILTKTDLQELLSDMYNKQYNNQSDPKSNTINQIQKYILSSGNNDIQLQYSVWKHFADKAKQFIRTPNDEDLVDVPKEEKKNTDIDDVHEILNLEYELYSINLSSNIHTVKIIDDKNLDRLTRVVSHLIFVRLKEFKQDMVDPKFDLEKLQDVSEKIKHVAEKATTLRSRTGSTDFVEEIKNELRKYDTNEIDWQTFKYMFANQDGTNKRLLKDLAFYAWIKFAPHNKKDEEKEEEEEEEKDDEMKLIDASFISNKNKNKIEPLNVDVLNVHIFKIFKDLLLLKQSIDSYTIIITNLQKMIDVVTPLLLLFVYLSEIFPFISSKLKIYLLEFLPRLINKI
eukprot:43070_1